MVKCIMHSLFCTDISFDKEFVFVLLVLLSFCFGNRATEYKYRLDDHFKFWFFLANFMYEFFEQKL